MWRAICKELKWPFIELYNNDSPPVPVLAEDEDTQALFECWLEPDSDDHSGLWESIGSDDDDDQPVLVIAEEDD